MNTLSQHAQSVVMIVLCCRTHEEPVQFKAGAVGVVWSVFFVFFCAVVMGCGERQVDSVAVARPYKYPHRWYLHAGGQCCCGVHGLFGGVFHCCHPTENCGPAVSGQSMQGADVGTLTVR